MNNICDLSGIIILIEHHIHQNLSKIYGGARLVGHDLAYLPPSIKIFTFRPLIAQLRYAVLFSLLFIYLFIIIWLHNFTMVCDMVSFVVQWQLTSLVPGEAKFKVIIFNCSSVFFLPLFVSVAFRYLYALMYNEFQLDSSQLILNQLSTCYMRLENIHGGLRDVPILLSYVTQST